MGEGLDPKISRSEAISNRGILTIMGVLVAIGTLAGAVFGETLFAIGVVFGGVMSAINFVWLDRVTKSIFRGSATASTPLLAGQFILRYIAIGAVLLLIHLTGALPLAAVIAGLGAFAVAVVIQGLRNIISNTL